MNNVFKIGDLVRCKYNKKFVGMIVAIETSDVGDRYILDCDAHIPASDLKYFELVTSKEDL